MAARFDATADYLLELVSGGSFNSLTICGWARLTTLVSGFDSVCDVVAATGRAVLNYDGSLAAFGLYNGAYAYFSEQPAEGEWFFWAVVLRDGSGNQLGYWSPVSSNTVYTTSQAQASEASAPTVEIGNNLATEYWNGRIAAVKIYNAILTQAEIEQEKWSIRPKRTTNLYSWSPLFTDANDRGGSGNNWTENGTLTWEDGPPIGWGARTQVAPGAAAAATDLKISQFTALTAPVVADLVCIVDSTTSPASKKLTIDNLLTLFISDVTMTVLTATSGATYTPPTGAKKLLLGLVGGGGGGNGGNNTDSAGGGGGGGGTCIKLIASTGVTNGTYVVGPGGGVSVTGTASSGANTTFNIDGSTTITAGGGAGGAQGAAFTVVGVGAAGGAGGTATNGDLNIPGMRGERGVIYSGTNGWAGSGGDSVFGFGAGNPGVNTTGSPGGAYGGGGCGGHASAVTNKEGSAGAKGTIFILEFFG